MKPLFKILFVMALAAFGFTSQTYAQEAEANDVVYMLNGEERAGKVTGVSGSAIKFKFAGEDLEYEIDREEVNQIVFASGRTQLINEMAAPVAEAAPAITQGAPASAAAAATTSATTSTAAERKGKMAVLPFEVVTNDGSIDTEALGREIQTECIGQVTSLGRRVEVQSPMATNALLAKNGITDIQTVLPEELAAMLGVEFLVYGTFDVTNKGTFTTGSDYTSVNQKNDKDKDKKKATAVSSGSSSTRISYDTKVHMSIYNDTGDMMYTDTRTPFSGAPDNYKSSIKNLVKKSPFG